MLFDINRVKENKIRSRETRSRHFLLKRVFSDLENRILELTVPWEYGLIEGCRKNDLEELSKDDRIIIAEFKHVPAENKRVDLYANLMQMHWSNDPYSDFSEKVKLIKPKGQFFCCLFGAETLNELRDSFSKAEMELFGVTSPRISPLPEIRDVGNLAAKVGLNNSVVDRDIIKVGYKSIEDLFSDLKKMGETNAILGRRKGLTTKKLIHKVEK
ncbi:MAG: hypothetical protein VXW39_00255, partial [Pseudomonadota bacterium]|nr:hypothetical protein [Pseudomonadota bacterium]